MNSVGNHSRRVFLRHLAGLGALAAELSLLAGCDQLPFVSGRSARTYRIGVLSGSSLDAQRAQIAAFREGLREYGYVEGQNIIIELRFAEGDNDRFPELASQLVRLPVDLLVIPNTFGVAVAKQVTTTVPIVMTDVGDVVDAGLVASLGRPGGNVTGIASPVVGPKQLELLRGTLDGSPYGVTRVAVLWRATNDSTIRMRKLLAVAEPLNVNVFSAEVHASEDVPVALEAASRAGAEALLTFLDPLTLINMRTIIDFASSHRLPSMFSDRRFVDAGGLMSYGTNRPEMYRRTASYVDRILKGASPAELPVELTSVLEFVVNVTTAKALGITFAPDVMAQVTEWVR